MILEMKLLGVLLLAMFGSAFAGYEWANEISEKKIKHLQNKVDFYESHNHYVYPGSAKDADENERW